MTCGRVHEYKLEPSTVDAKLPIILARKGASREACHISWDALTMGTLLSEAGIGQIFGPMQPYAP